MYVGITSLPPLSSLTLSSACLHILPYVARAQHSTAVLQQGYNKLDDVLQSIGRMAMLVLSVCSEGPHMAGEGKITC